MFDADDQGSIGARAVAKTLSVYWTSIQRGHLSYSRILQRKYLDRHSRPYNPERRDDVAGENASDKQRGKQV